MNRGTHVHMNRRHFFFDLFVLFLYSHVVAVVYLLIKGLMILQQGMLSAAHH